jgi:hypothetical protein
VHDGRHTALGATLTAPPADPVGAITSKASRGFTGHQHLADVGLIHMNGRVYEPACSVDNCARTRKHDLSPTCAKLAATSLVAG